MLISAFSLPNSIRPAKTTCRGSFRDIPKWFSGEMMEGNTTKKKGTNSSSTSRCWTNERHLRFLNSIEASFVRAMFENNGRSDLHLDRHIPDSSDSTQDLPNQRRRRWSGSAAERPSMKGSKKNKEFLSPDQVVPQLEIRGDNEDDKDNGDGRTSSPPA